MIWWRLLNAIKYFLRGQFEFEFSGKWAISRCLMCYLPIKQSQKSLTVNTRFPGILWNFCTFYFIIFDAHSLFIVSLWHFCVCISMCVDTFERRKVMNVYTYMTLRGSWSHSVVLFPFKDLTAGATWYVFFTKISFMYSLQFVKYSVMCNLADYSGEITILIRTLNLNIDDIVFRGMLKVLFRTHYVYFTMYDKI